MNPWNPIADLSLQDARTLQSRKLQRFVSRYLFPFSPHYQRVFRENNIDPDAIRTVEDLKRLPFTSKADFVPPGGSDDVAKAARDFILQPDAKKIKEHWPLSSQFELMMLALARGRPAVREALRREFAPVFLTFTTGTTSQPVSFIYSRHDIQNLHVSGHRMLRLFSVSDEDRVVNMFPYAPHLAIWQVVFGGLEAGVLILSTGGGKVMGTDGNIKVMLKMRPSVMLGVPSYIYHVVRVAAEQGVKLDFLKRVILGASACGQDYKDGLARLLERAGAREVKIFGTYGFTEARAAWAECPVAGNVSSGYHLYPDKEIFEIIDPKTGEVKGEGESGEIVYSAIDARGSAVLRYRTGDYCEGGITWEPCPHCKRAVPRLSSRIGRLSELKDMHFSKIKGSLVNFNNFAQVFAAVEGVEEWQIELRKKDNDPFEIDELLVYISVKDPSRQQSTVEEVQKYLLQMTEVSANAVNCLPLEEMVRRCELETANKAKRIVDLRSQEQG